MAALAIGFIEVIFTVEVTPYVNYQVPNPSFLPAARYLTLPVLGIDAILILGVDACLRRHGPARLAIRLRPRTLLAVAALAVAALAGVLGFGWITDFRYATERTYTGYWQVTAWHWLHECTLSPTGTITVPVWQAAPGPVDCARCAAEPLRRRAHPGRPPALYTLMPK